MLILRLSRTEEAGGRRRDDEHRAAPRVHQATPSAGREGAKKTANRHAGRASGPGGPRPGATAEDDGALIFTAMDAWTRRSSLIVVDARTMKTVANGTLPTITGFTIHGEFYPPE